MEDLAIGDAHIMALTANGEVYGWGSDDGSSGGVSPLSLMHSRTFVGIACGPNQVVTNYLVFFFYFLA